MLAGGGGRWWSGITGCRSRVTTAGSPLQQEWGDAVGPGLGGGAVPVVRSKGGRSRVPGTHTIVLRRRVQAVQAC